MKLKGPLLREKVRKIGPFRRVPWLNLSPPSRDNSGPKYNDECFALLGETLFRLVDTFLP